MTSYSEKTDLSREILSQITIYNKYSKYLESKNRRETWEELVNRNKNMHIKKYPKLKDKINMIYNNFVLTKKVLPSMRSMQFAGKPIEISPNRLYNCAFLPIDSIDAFSETMFLLLGGTGVGYSVQKHDIEKLPEIKHPNQNRTRRYLIADNIEGWADAVKVLFKSYTGKISSNILFDYSDIRPKGAKLITSGGKAPGPQPLKECLIKIRGILDHKQENEKLTTLEAHDIMCFIADAVLAGGIRRAAMIALFSLDDEEMLSAKTGNWWELNPQRGRANNSAVVLRHKITKDIFYNLWERTQASKAGEPGIYLTNDKTWGANPCFSYDTPILTPYGYKPIGELEGDETEFINYRGETVQGTVFKSGRKSIYKIKLSNKVEIKTTTNHKFMLNDGSEKEAQYITKEDRLMPYYSINKEVNKFTELGFIQGGGSTGRLKSDSHLGLEIYIGEKDLDIAELFNIKETGRHYIRGYNELLKELGFSSNALPERGLPSGIWNWDYNNLRFFLQGLYSANGSIITNHRIAFKGTCYTLIENLQKILKEKFDINSYITINKEKEIEFSNGNYICKESYDLNISKLSSIIRFAAEIGFVQRYKQESLKNLILNKGPKVLSSKICEVEDVFDFTLYDNTHWGVINGVIAHNCVEIALRPYQFCNLTEINGLDIKTQEELNNRVQAASFIGTLQAGYTDFHYLREIWKKTTEKDALIGVSFTGLANEDLLNLDFKEAANLVIQKNKEVAKEIGINQAKRTTCVKPAGTTSLVLGTSSGIHAWHSPYYIRRIRLLKTEPLYKYLKNVLPELVEDEYFRPHDTAVLSIPQKSPDHAIYRDESALDLLSRVANTYKTWVKSGHIDGQNTHNISATISVKDDEWDSVKEWMWQNRDSYNGITVLPYDGGNYKQAPFETCSKEKYEELYKLLTNIDLSKVDETEDLTNHTENLACSGNNCEIN